MSETRLEQTENPIPPDSGSSEPGEVLIDESTTGTTIVALAPPANVSPVPAATQRPSNRSATVEHLAARRTVTPLNADDREVKQKISELRAEMTTLVTGLRWGGVPVSETAERMIPLLNMGSLQQWIPILVPNLLEIDRAGNLVPAWFNIIEREDPIDIAPDANPAETMIGRARRIGILMLGYYKTPEIAEFLGKLATDPHSSLYATRSLVKQNTIASMQAMANALKSAEGWAKVDIIDAYATLNQSRFYELMLASGLDRANGLESYIAIPLYRTIPLAKYLRGGKDIPARLTQQAALVVGQVLQDSSNTAPASPDALPIIFERDLREIATALFEGTRNTPFWQNVTALHRLGLFLGRYWANISRGAVQDQRIVQPVYACLSLMPDIERWMNSTGRDVLLNALANSEEAFLPAMKVLNELRDPRAASVLLSRLDSVTQITDRTQAIQVGHICDTLAQLGDPRATSSMLSLIKRVANIDLRASRGRRRDNLAVGDPDLPTSIVYAAVIRAFAQSGDRGAIDIVARAAGDFDPYVRTQALEALKKIDPNGEDMRSRRAAREALNDPRDTVVRLACQLLTQYHDTESILLLRNLAETRPEFAPSAQDALRKLEM
ncbi:MAG TPA: HEAT repeat domain-containing protein [Ktedonobacteraceae bacterium]|nr:HEAT repeat domain-containing protein [Ktedonobacteraceae bacterium]